MNRRTWLKTAIALPFGSLAIPRRLAWAAAERRSPHVGARPAEELALALAEGADIAKRRAAKPVE